jgi:hypothetical protein
MSFSDTHEAGLRSYIEARTRSLQNGIETAARNRDNLNTAALEQQIDRESDRFVADVTTRLNGMRDEIKARRPRDEQQPDYAARMAQYQQFVASASTGVQRVTGWVNLIFEKIIDIIKKTVQWIVDQAQTVINVIEMIRDSFNEFTRFLFRE